MSERKCGCIYTDASNTPAVRKGFEPGGSLKQACAEHAPQSLFEQFRNPGTDTYNGVRMLAALSGISETEIAWTAKRLKHLMTVEKKPRPVALVIVRAEVKHKPWEHLK